MKLAVTRQASAEIGAAAEWYELREPRVGRAFLAQVDRALQTIRTSPKTWPLWPGAPAERNMRRFLLSRFPFAIAYRIGPKQVAVVAVAHTSRRPNYWLNRLDE